MSNLQAALGLAQIQRAEIIVAKKRQIFEWYKSRLADIEEISMNVEKPWTRSIYWMSSIVLSKSLSVSRDDFMKKLRERNIDSRPFFYPISSFPMFKGTVVNNPVAYDVPLRAINLPSGHMRTEEEIDYICAHVREILGKKPGFVSVKQPTGWLAYRDNVMKIIEEIKTDKTIKNIEILDGNKIVGKLLPISKEQIATHENVKLLMDWRIAAQEWFPSQSNISFEGTKKWAEYQLIDKKERILFFVENSDGLKVGHVGLFRFNYSGKFCELDNIIRGKVNISNGIMTLACKTLINWCFDELGIEKLFLRFASDNNRAMKLYQRLGFIEIQRFPLKKIVEGDLTKWIDVVGFPYMEIERYFVTMKMDKIKWKKHA